MNELEQIFIEKKNSDLEKLEKKVQRQNEIERESLNSCKTILEKYDFLKKYDFDMKIELKMMNDGGNSYDGFYSNRIELYHHNNLFAILYPCDNNPKFNFYSWQLDGTKKFYTYKSGIEAISKRITFV